MIDQALNQHQYIKIDGDTILYSSGKVLKFENKTIFNPTEEQMLAAGWQVYIAPEPTDEEKLENAKNEKIQQIISYDSSTNVNSFSINGQEMWLDHELRQQIKTSAEAYAALGYDNMTKVFNGQEFTYPVSTWLQMLNALEIYAAEALNSTERHKNNVMQLDNIQDVIDYDYTTNYPEKLTF